MKILFVPNAVSGEGGSIHSLLSVIKAISKEHEKYILLYKRGPILKDLRKLNVMPVYLDYIRCVVDEGKNVFREMSTEHYNLKQAIKLAEIVKKEKIGLIFTNDSTTDIGAMAAFISGVGHIWHHREFIYQHFHKKYIFFQKELFLKRKSYCTATSNVLMDELRTRYGIRKGSVLYNWFDAEKYYMKKRERGTSLQCLIAGYMYEDKHQLEAIEAWDIIINNYGVPAYLEIIGVGSPEYIVKLKQKIAEKSLDCWVSIRNYVENITEVRKGKNVEISCSRWEGFGRNIIEAMMGGLFVVGAESGATAELIQSGDTGLLYKPGDCEDLANKILWIWNNFDQADEIISKGQDYALRSFSEMKGKDRLLSIIGEFS